METFCHPARELPLLKTVLFVSVFSLLGGYKQSRFELIKEQAFSKSCGYEVFLTIAKIYDKKDCIIGQEYLKERISMLDIKRLSNDIGMTPIGMKVDAGGLYSLLSRGIVVLHKNTEEGHFVVGISADVQGVVILDPSSGKDYIYMKEFKDSYSNIVLFYESQQPQNSVSRIKEKTMNEQKILQNMSWR